MKSKSLTKHSTSVILFVMLLTLAIFHITGCSKQTKDAEKAFSGAKPLALAKAVPDGLAFTVEGKVDHTYTFNSDSFRLLEKARVRTHQITPKGEMLGAYYYTGVPVVYLMEAIDAVKSKKDAFDRPLDMIVVFQSADGKTAKFSYGELVMCSDSLPVLLAYDRQPVLPHHKPEVYTKNKLQGNITGLSLVCPRETDSSRFLDNVVKATLILPKTPDDKLPTVQKYKNCDSPSITCMENDLEKPASYDRVKRAEHSDWFRIGHGRGIRSDKLGSASGYHIRDFLKKNFTAIEPHDFFLVVACDGYRSIYSAREIFNTAAGNGFILYDTVDDEPVKEGLIWGAVTDYFMDRCVRSVTHVIRIPAKDIK